ncbi:hypothetical protein SAMN05444673_2547 [Bacillus sp. OV166]|uniref:hypothetical protein n=1 Tax=Bacillus sp. OV166 TaxID=1882763 RepID=UPI000A2ADA0F|nr:hypothetical protein [Bacillus sp. OV166]SMQ75792.1 hypothetical protein SAMN05444673_2547 [Bacillus sp. OV166]
MDRKTLELMEEKSKKAREIVNAIDELSGKALSIEGCEEVEFFGMRDCLSIQVTDKPLLEEFKFAFVNAAIKEIERLEQELAEL